eukprot:6169311-Amphidinium_carterae.1
MSSSRTTGGQAIGSGQQQSPAGEGRRLQNGKDVGVAAELCGMADIAISRTLRASFHRHVSWLLV